MRKGTTWDGGLAPVELILGRPQCLDNAKIRVVARNHPAMMKKKAANDLRIQGQKTQSPTTPEATLALMKLEAALASRKIPDLNAAIEDGEAAGLADGELEQARALRHHMSQRVIVNYAASAKRRAKSKFEQMKRGNATLDEAIAAGDEAEKLCAAAGYSNAKKCPEYAPWESWKIAFWNKVQKALETQNEGMLQDVVEECQAAGLLERMPEIQGPIQQACDILGIDQSVETCSEREASPQRGRTQSPPPQQRSQSAPRNRAHSSPFRAH
jgi:hypothetical protein